MSTRRVWYEARGFLVGFVVTLLLIAGCGTDAVGELIGIDPVVKSGDSSPVTPTAS